MYAGTCEQYGLRLAHAAIAEHAAEIAAFADATATRATYGTPLNLSESFAHARMLRHLRTKSATLLRAQAEWAALNHKDDDPDGDWDDFGEIDETPDFPDNPDRPFSTSPHQLQKKYKHARVFGFPKNYNPANAKKFGEVLQNFVNNPATEQRSGTYFEQPALHYLNRETGMNVVTKPDGEFWTSFQLGADQLLHWPDIR